MGPCWTSFDFASALDMLAAARALLSYCEKQDYATGIRALPREREFVVDGGWWAGVNRVFRFGWRKRLLAQLSLACSLQQQPGSHASLAADRVKL